MKAACNKWKKLVADGLVARFLKCCPYRTAVSIWHRNSLDKADSKRRWPPGWGGLAIASYYRLLRIEPVSYYLWSLRCEDTLWVELYAVYVIFPMS